MPIIQDNVSLKETEAEKLELLLRKVCKIVTNKEIIGTFHFEFIFYKNGGMGDKPTIYQKLRGDLSELK